ncbi:MAG: DUF951 domain-containing protein [Clostridia bacterium]
MTGKIDVHIGDVLEMRKAHPCGAWRWTVTRVGMDFRLKCTGCEREILVPRARALRSAKRLIRGEVEIIL